MNTDFSGFLDQRRLAPSSKRTYSAIVRKIQSENAQLDKYTYRDVIKLVGAIQHNFRGTSFPHTSLAALKHYFSFLIEEGKRESHPCLTIRLKSNISREIIPTDLFSMNELNLLLKRTERYKELELRNKVLLSLLIYQGITPVELSKSLWTDIDPESETIFLRGSRMISKRRLKLLPQQLDWIDSYGLERTNSPFVNKDQLLLGKLGNGITTDDIHYLISTSQHFFPERKLTAPTIRQSVIAFWLNEKHVPLEQVQLWAGHKWISSTQRYHFPDFESDKRILKELHPQG
jgi:integrase/recombinase XerD